MNKIKKVVLLPDIHYPEHSAGALEATLKFVKDFKPDEIVFMGDQLDLSVLSHWNKDKRRKVELKRLKNDYDGFEEEVLSPVEKLTKKITWITGNHEDWVNQYIDYEPGVEGMLEPEEYFKFKRRRIEYIPFNGIYKIGKLNLIHGYYCNQNHATTTVNAFESNVAYAHVHTTQEHTKTTPMDVNDYHSAVALPCLCNTNPDYMKNKPNAWVHGFGVVYLLPNGNFNLYVVKIVNNKFIFNNRFYESKKK